MSRKQLTLIVAGCVLLCSTTILAEQPDADSLQTEIRGIRQLLADLDTRLGRLEESIAATKHEAEADGSSDSELMWRLIGIRLQRIDPEDLPDSAVRYRGGMKVVAVRPEGPAEGEGIQAGDIILGIHTWETLDEDDVRHILSTETLRENKPVKIYLLRNRETLFALVEPSPR